MNAKWQVCLLILVISNTVSAQVADDAVPDIDSKIEATGVTEEHAIEAPGQTSDETQDNILGTEIEYSINRKVNKENPCDRQNDTYNYDVNWYDSSQAYVNSRFCEPALWFDNFFANDRVFSEGVAGTYIRWRNDFTYDEEDKFKLRIGINASVELPGLENRLRLTIENDEDEDLRDIAPGNGQDTTNSLGMQLDFFDSTRSKFNVSVSLKPRIRFRYRYT